MERYHYHATEDGYIVRDVSNKIVGIIKDGCLDNLGADKKSVEDYCKKHELCK